MDNIDIFHPLTTLQWTEHTSFSDLNKCSDHCVCLNDRIYVVAATTGVSNTLLLSISLDFKECVRLTLPVESFALTHYQSQLVLVGEQHSYDNPSNELWVSDDGINWKQSLPPRRVRRRAVSVVNTGSPECLVVVGGNVAQKSVNEATVEVFVNGEWFIAQHLPNALRDPKCYIHTKTVIVTDYSEPTAYCCHLESLLASCVQSKGDEQVEPSSGNVWKKFDHPSTILYNSPRFASILSFRQQLVVLTNTSINTLCPDSHTWLQMGSLPKDVPARVCTIPSIVLSTGELLIMPIVDRDVVIYTASLKISPCYADEAFSISALKSLEAAGFKLHKIMAEVYMEVVAAIGIVKDVRDKISPEKSVANAFEYWLSNNGSLRRPPTWKALLGMLCELGVGELSQQIEDYLSYGGVGAPSLWEQCMGTIMSGLLQQRLEPDQLHAKLPDYIPTTLRNAIVRSFKARTLQLVPFSYAESRGYYSHLPPPSGYCPTPSGRVFKASTFDPNYDNPRLAPSNNFVAAPRGAPFLQPQGFSHLQSQLFQPQVSSLQSTLQQPSSSLLQQPILQPLGPSLQPTLQQPSSSPLQQPILGSPLQSTLQSTLQQPSSSLLQQPILPPLGFPLQSTLQQPSSSPLQQPILGSPLQSTLQQPSSSPLQQPILQTLGPPLQSTLSSSPLQLPTLQQPSSSSLQPLTLQSPNSTMLQPNSSVLQPSSSMFTLLPVSNSSRLQPASMLQSNSSMLQPSSSMLQPNLLQPLVSTPSQPLSPNPPSTTSPPTLSAEDSLDNLEGATLTLLHGEIQQLQDILLDDPPSSSDPSFGASDVDEAKRLARKRRRT